MSFSHGRIGTVWSVEHLKLPTFNLIYLILQEDTDIAFLEILTGLFYNSISLRLTPDGNCGMVDHFTIIQTF